MLDNEEYIKQYWEKAKPKLGWISKDGAPIVVVITDEDHLQDGEGAPGKVQQDVTDAPAHGALSPEMSSFLSHLPHSTDSKKFSAGYIHSRKMQNMSQNWV